MDIFNKLFPKKTQFTQDQLKLQSVLRYLSLKDLEKIAKEYISKNPQVPYKDSNGIERLREPNRYDYEKAILSKVAFESVIELFPKLKDKY